MPTNVTDMVDTETTSAQRADSLRTWTERLAVSSLPVFRSSAHYLAGLTESSGVSWERLCIELPLDPGIVLAMMRRANTAKRHLGGHVATTENAALMLGVRNLRSLTSALEQFEPPGRQPQLQGYMRVVSRAYHAAMQAHDWACLRGDMTPKEVMAATLLHDVGEMALWVRGDMEMQRIQELMREEEMPEDEAQYVVLGFSVEQLSHALAVRWNLPELLTEALEAENAGQRRARGVMLAAQLARLAEQDWYSEAMEECLTDVAEFLEMEFDRVVARVHQTAVEAARDTLVYGVRPAAARLPMLPEGPADGDSASGEADEHEAGEAGRPKHFCLAPQPAIYERAFAELSRGPESDLELSDLMALAMRGLHDGLGLNRVVFAMLTPDHGALRARFLAGTDHDPHFNRFAVTLDEPHLFQRMLEKPQSVWVNDDNRERLWPLVPAVIRELIRTDSFFAVSVVVEGKPIGLFYADRHFDDCHLDPVAYERFKRLCLLAGRALGRERQHRSH